MINFVICEHDLEINENIKAIISDYILAEGIEGNIVIISDNFKQIIKFSKENNHDTNIYFLDVILDMNINGLMLAKEIRRHDYLSNIVFITNHLELLLKTFEYKLKALDYIHKSDMSLKSRIIDCINIALDENNKRNQRISSANNIVIKSGRTYHNIPFTKIIYLETDQLNRKVILHTIDGEIEFYDTLKNIKHKLNRNFFYCHRSYIVNIEHVLDVNIDKIHMHLNVSNGSKLLLSRKYLKDILINLGA